MVPPIALWLLAAVQAPAGAPAYPLAEILSEARQACSPDALPAASGTAESQGWAPHRPEAGSWFANHVARNSDGGVVMEITPATFSKFVSGRRLLAFVAHIEFTFYGRPTFGFSCEIFDPEAPAISLRDISRWARRAPKMSGEGYGVTFARWEPGLGRGLDETTIKSASSDRENAGQAAPGLTYMALKATRDGR